MTPDNKERRGTCNVSWSHPSYRSDSIRTKSGLPDTDTRSAYYTHIEPFLVCPPKHLQDILRSNSERRTSAFVARIMRSPPSPSNSLFLDYPPAPRTRTYEQRNQSSSHKSRVPPSGLPTFDVSVSLRRDPFVRTTTTSSITDAIGKLHIPPQSFAPSVPEYVFTPSFQPSTKLFPRPAAVSY